MKYEITLIERVTFLNDRLNPVDGYRVTFRTETGIIDWIDLAKAAYTDANVKSEIEKAIAKHIAVTKPPK